MDKKLKILNGDESMSLRKLNEISVGFANSIISNFEQNISLNKVVLYRNDECLDGDFDQFFGNSGLYGFTIKRGNSVAVAYIGKSEGKNRLREHLTGRNKDGTPLAISVGTKHQNIRNAIRNGFEVRVHFYSDPEFEKANLSFIETTALKIIKSKFKSIFPNEEAWVQRIG